MRRLLLVILGLLAFRHPSFAQGNTLTLNFTGAPSGNCAFMQVARNNATGAYYTCGTSATWQLMAVSSSSSTPQFARVGIGVAPDATTPLTVKSAGGGSVLDVYTGSTLLSRIYDTNTPNAIGSQIWNLFASDVGTQTGTILYKTPGGAPGIVMYTGCCSNRVNFANVGTYTYIQYDNDADGTPALAVKAGGGVGIGTYTPTYALQVAPTVNVTAGQTVFIRDATASTGKTTMVLKGGAVAGNILEVRDTSNNLNAIVTDAGVATFVSLKTTGAAGGKKTVCVDTSTGQLYASSTGTDCSN